MAAGDDTPLPRGAIYHNHYMIHLTAEIAMFIITDLS